MFQGPTILLSRTYRTPETRNATPLKPCPAPSTPKTETVTFTLVQSGVQELCITL